MAFGDLPKPQQMAILIGVPVLIIGLFGYLSYNELKALGPDPALDVVSFVQQKSPTSLYDQIETTNTQTATRQAVANRFDAVETQLEGQQERLRFLERELPSEEKKEEMRQDLQEWMRETTDAELGTVRYVSLRILSGNTNTNTRRSRSRSGPQYREVTYKLEFEADMNGLLAYMDRIEDAERHLAIRSLKVEPGTVSIDQDSLQLLPPLHSVTADVVTYVYEGSEK